MGDFKAGFDAWQRIGLGKQRDADTAKALQELKQRVKALEAAQQQPEPIDEAENDRRFEAAMAAIDAATREQIRAALGLPERSSLVERLMVLFGHHGDGASRAAIREVAAWLHTAGMWEAADVLEQEAER